MPNLPMKGWVTWSGVIGLVALAVYTIAQGDVETGLAYLVAALGLLGIGRKIEKPK